MNISNKVLKNILQKIILTIGIVFVIFLSIASIILLTQKPKDLQISNVDMTAIHNGIYIGSADSGLVKATVKVEVNNGAILTISILEHEHLLGKKAEKITESIISQQSLEVDVVASATYSSNTLRKAVENALRQRE